MNRALTFAEALREAQAECLEEFPEVFLMGLGVPDPKGVFGTTLGLQERFGAKRVFDIPLSENAVTGIALGAAITGMRPILTHQRVDFAVTSMEQLVNQAAKWHYMFGGAMKAPMVIRMIIGRGWGQGPQHSQSLQAWFAHVPGLKVVMPTTAHDAKGLLIASVEDDNPVVFLEHRWLYGVQDEVPAEYYRTPLGKASVIREGTDATVVAVSYMTLEALRAAETLARSGVSVEVIDLRTVRPWDVETVLASVRKTGRLVVTDTGWTSFGISAEIVATVTERAFGALKAAPVRIALPECPSPTSPALAAVFFPRSPQICAAVCATTGRDARDFEEKAVPWTEFDRPDPSFQGPF